MSSSQRFCYVGIEPSANSHGFSFVSLSDQLSLLAIGEGTLKDIFAYLAGQETVLVAIHAPAFLGSLHSSGSNPIQENKPPVKEYRSCEQEIWQASIPISFTPAKLNRFSSAARNGYQLFQLLQRYGFCFEDSVTSTRLLLETCPAACFYQMIQTQTLPEDSFLGRLQRQLILHNHHLPVQDPMDFFEEITRYKLLTGKVSLKAILVPEELNAMMIAYLAWLSHQHPEKVNHWGDGTDGKLVLPIQEPTP